ncbi:MAG: response regulator [Candidatus Tectimicrobiota bacterium]
MATILIVDDHPTNRAFLITLLSYHGHRLLEAADGMEGLLVARAEHPDLVITDVLMPTMDGYDFVRRLRAEAGLVDTPVIFWSAYYLEREARALAHACGVLHLLVKPCDPEEVLSTVQAALENVLTPVVPAPLEDFDHAHLRVMTNKLAQTVEELRTTNRKLGVVLETSRRLALARDLPQLLEDCCRMSREIIGAQWALIGILSDDGPLLHHWATAGLAPELTALLGVPQAQHGVFSELLHGRSVCRLTNASGDPQALGFAPGYPPIYALLGATIASPFRVYGCLVLANRLGTDAFSEEDERLATTLAAQLAVAYENASLYIVLEERATALGREVVEHQRTEAQLQIAEARYRTLVEHIPAITYVSALDPDQGTLYISPQVEAILGYTPAEWRATPQLWSTRLHPQDYPRVLARLARSQVTGEPFQAEYRLYARDNHEVWFHHEAVIVKDNTAEDVLCLQGILLDITERKHTEAALRDSEARYRDLVENANDIIYTRDLEGLLTSLNRKGEEVMGYSREEILGMPLSDLVVPEQQALVREIVARTLTDTAPEITEVTIVGKHGQRVTLEVRTRLLTQAGQPVGVQGIARDVTERKRLEAQLRQAQKMEAVGTLAGGIAHDFNNILAAIFGYTELTLDEVPSTSAAARNLQQVLVASTRARELVRQLLAFSHRSEQNRRPILLHLLAGEVLTLLRATLPVTITLQTALDATGGAVMADPIQIHQVLLNLYTNAVHAMRETGGTLEIRLDVCELTTPGATGLSALTPGVYLRFTVRDTGHGIAPEFLDRIFEPFFTTKRPGEGTGLGLAVAHGIVSSHGGAMTVASTVGQGTTFEVYLPRSNQIPLGEDVDPEEPLPTGHERILFVDDEEPLASIHQEALSRLGYTVVVHTDSRVALDTFRAAPADFDLLITDHTMPHLTGVELIQAVRRLRPHLPVILCTGFSPAITAEQAAALGIETFCMKPLPLRDLALLIRQAFAQRPAPDV